MKFVSLLTWMAAVGALPVLHAWDYEGHRMVNQLALAGLPAEFPAFARTKENAERIAFLGGEPDRWKNVPDLPLRHGSGPDHYFDMEGLELAGFRIEEISPLRYEFAARFALGRAAHPENFPALNPEKNADRTREWIGFLPWAITENYARLKSGFSYLKAYQEFGGTPEEIANARANIVYVMGVMGHFVADGAQPLHTTRHHNGWVGDNPRGVTTSPQIHVWIDGGFNQKTGLLNNALLARARPARGIELAAKTGVRDAMFAAVLAYLRTQNARVAPLYDEEKAGQFKADGTPGSTDGKAFIEEQLLRGGEMLSALWLTAWQAAPVDNYLQKQLTARTAAASAPVAR